MTRTLFHNIRLVLPSGITSQGWLVVEQGLIQDLGWDEPPQVAGQRVDGRGHLLAPGLIDLHVHGALGHDTMDATPEGLRQMARFYAAHGVTGFLATTMSAPTDAIQRALNNVALMMHQGTGGAALLGAHVEGPYLDAEKRGCQGREHIRCADLAEYAPFLATGIVRLITLAPEYPENQALIRDALKRGVVVAAGHTRASYEIMQQAVTWGVSQVTHLYNAMAPLHHREPGAVGAALSNPLLYVQLIADGIHVHPAMLDLTVRLKGIERTMLITDAMAGAGMADGRYDLGGIQVTVQQGVARDAEGALAGSTLTLEHAVQGMMRAAALPLWQAWRMASETPARAMGWAHKGSLVVGKAADLVMIDDLFQVSLTMVGGEVVYRRS